MDTTMLRNFDTPLDSPVSTEANIPLRNFDDLPPASPTASVVVTEPIFTVKASSSRSFLTRDTESWEWQDLRDYVVAEIESRFGPFPRESTKEAGIFKAFLSRWGSDAGRIARYAFEVLDGRWGGAPISIYRFTKSSDDYFAAEVLKRLS